MPPKYILWPSCSVDGCGAPSHAKAMCRMHYLRNKRTGSPLRRTPEQRFWAKVDPCRTDGCAVWMSRIDADGYGRFWNGKDTRAHHFLVGKPPSGLVWGHVKERGCSHRNCVWPEHLELVTSGINTLRGDSVATRNAAKTHCPQGHQYDAQNTYIWRGGRKCRACDRAIHRARSGH